MFLARKTREAVDFLRRRGVTAVSRGLALESGMVGFSNELSRLVVAPCKKIPYFPFPQGPGRRGLLLCGQLEGEGVVVLEGRGRLYEGYFHRELAFPFRVLAEMGMRKVILAARVLPLAAGWEPGEVVAVDDHIDLSGGSPLRGLDPPAPPGSMDPAGIYSAELRDLGIRTADEQGIPLRRAVVALLAGPAGPTPAEARAYSRLGADLFSFSLAAEVMVTLHLGIEMAAFGIVASALEGGADTPPPEWEPRHLSFFRELLSRA